MGDQDGQNDDPPEGSGSADRSTGLDGPPSVTEREYELIFKQSPEEIYINDTEGHILDVNETVLEELGYTREELLSMEVPDIEVGLDEEVIREKLQSLDAGSIQRVEEEGLRRRKDGSTFPVEVWVSKVESDGTERFIALSRDITERKEREHELERQKAFTDDLLDAIEDVVYVLGPDGDLINWNAAAEEVTGYTSEELGSMNALDFFTEEDTEAVAAALEEAFETGHARVEVDFLTANDESIPYEFIANVFGNPEGEPVVAGVGRDRRLHAEYEQELEEQRDNLEILNQVVRHDIRNDMAVVRGRANLLEEYVEEAGREHLEAVQSSTENAIQLTGTARDLSETMLSTEEDVEPVRLDQHLEPTIENARSKFDNTVITVEDGIPDVRVCGNTLLKAVFRNLIQNAVIHNDKEVPAVDILTALDEETVTVAIADNGPGIPDDQKETIFGKGEKGLDSPGTGIGLYLVESLVEQYGGDVWAEDNDPEGSVFYVELPRVDEEEQ
ncbi:PAS domain S-box protein [Halopenitus sp. H-Gu1]|uniref:PAS domain S-box protein n=1 Tax=Halopenitus sp. H-Gu1 TaxID=3242697 RepID=UPI00359D75FA